MAQEDLRRKAVKAVLESMRQQDAAELFGVTRQAVGKWIAAYRKGGLRALRAHPRGRPPGGSLLPWQAAQIARAVVDRPPDQLKLPFYLWTREAVAALIGQRFGIRLSVWTVGRYLARWGFTPQKPVRRAFEQDPQAVRRWLEEEYPEIRKQAKGEKAEICWGDEMGLRSDCAAGRTCGLRGQTPGVPGTGARFGCNLISAITNRGRRYFMVFKVRFRAGVLADFLRRLVKQVRRKVFVILDGHPVHRAHQVKEWVEDRSHQIRLFHLPSYRPDLNPDERVHNDVKTNAVGRRRARDREELVANVRGCTSGVVSADPTL
jgi:transposase